MNPLFDKIVARLKDIRVARRCVYCRPKHRIDDNDNAIPGDATDQSNEEFTDTFCNKWKECSIDESSYGVKPVDTTDPNTSWWLSGVDKPK